MFSLSIISSLVTSIFLIFDLNSSLMIIFSFLDSTDFLTVISFSILG